MKTGLEGKMKFENNTYIQYSDYSDIYENIESLKEL